ncbi:MAG: RluA family pseudouridine synthase [Pseudobdellovibrio sp.]
MIKRFLDIQSDGLLSEILHEEDFRMLLKIGAIYVNGERQTKDKIVSEHSDVHVYTEPKRYKCDYDWSSLIVFENDFFLVLNKPSGIPCHPVIDNAIENSLTQVSLARKYPLFITHRLDRLTSGLIVYAKKQVFAKDFNNQLRKRSVRKKYVALIESSEILPAKLTHYMDPAVGLPKKLSNQETAGWQICELEILEQKDNWLKINLLTGRTHQIRAQLSQIGAPIVGDSLYGAKLNFKSDAIALRSCEIEFNFYEQRMKFNLHEYFDSFDFVVE